MVRSVALFSLPLIDLVIAATRFRELERSVCFDSGCWQSLIVLINLVATWATLYLVLMGLALAVRDASSRFVRWSLNLVLMVVFTGLVIYCLFSWTVILNHGFPPSADATVFLLRNAAHLPSHLLQTNPELMLIGGVAIVIVAVAHSKVFLRFVSGMGRRWKARYLFGGLIMACGVSFASATQVTMSPSGMGISRIWLSQVAQHLDPDPIGVGHEDLADFQEAGQYQEADYLDERPPVIVVLMESLRRDLVDMEPSPIPFLKSLIGKEAVLLDKAYASASHSNYADVSFWYSRYPMRSLYYQGYPKDSPHRGISLFEVFVMHGYTTAYISSQNEKWGDMINWLNVPGEVDYFFHSEDYQGDTWYNEDDEQGIGRLIDAGIATAGKIEDGETLRIARHWIDGLGTRRDFFLGMNLQNTHFSYVVPPGRPAPFQPSDLAFRTVYYSWPVEHKEVVRNRYLNAVLNLDRELEDFASFLRRRGLWDDALVVFVGDSGEAFHEHGFGNHSGPMYDEVMRTLALIKPPRSVSMSTSPFPTAISHLDIAASIPDFLGMPVPGSFQGRSILDEGPRGPVYMHSNAVVKQNGIVAWPWKLLHTYYPYERTELYDLVRDPGEHSNLALTDPGMARTLAAQLDDWVKRNLTYYSDTHFLSKYDPPN